MSLIYVVESDEAVEGVDSVKTLRAGVLEAEDAIRKDIRDGAVEEGARSYLLVTLGYVGVEDEGEGEDGDTDGDTNGEEDPESEYEAEPFFQVAAAVPVDVMRRAVALVAQHDAALAAELQASLTSNLHAPSHETREAAHTARAPLPTDSASFAAALLWAYEEAREDTHLGDIYDLSEPECVLAWWEQAGLEARGDKSD